MHVCSPIVGASSRFVPHKQRQRKRRIIPLAHATNRIQKGPVNQVRPPQSTTLPSPHSSVVACCLRVNGESISAGEIAAMNLLCGVRKKTGESISAAKLV
jgi:hypothetical protein